MNLQKPIIKVASTLFPNWISNFAFEQLMNPQVRKLRVNELATLDKANKKWIQFRSFKIQTYKWGNPANEKVLLIHGWEGQAGNFSDLVTKLVAANFYVIAFDGPAHGFSSKGENVLFEFIDLVGELIKKYGCKKLISHSFGGVATTNALANHPEIKIEKYALLTTPNKFSTRIDDVATKVGITDKAKQLLVAKFEKETNLVIDNLSVSLLAPDLNVKKAKIFHDKNDQVIALSQSKEVCANWPNCQLKVVEGTGHFRILRTESVLDQVVEFLN